MTFRDKTSSAFCSRLTSLLWLRLIDNLYLFLSDWLGQLGYWCH